ncbi:MAG: hypothetical protein NTY01_02435 [Verrucomicrobia bacterium]|nr:hypothetical protein [Verrucomicrobiota bacterium]
MAWHEHLDALGQFRDTPRHADQRRRLDIRLQPDNKIVPLDNDALRHVNRAACRENLVASHARSRWRQGPVRHNERLTGKPVLQAHEHAIAQPIERGILTGGGEAGCQYGNNESANTHSCSGDALSVASCNH